MELENRLGADASCRRRHLIDGDDDLRAAGFIRRTGLQGVAAVSETMRKRIRYELRGKRYEGRRAKYKTRKDDLRVPAACSSHRPNFVLLQYYFVILSPSS